jgi:hypothetical protein
VRPSTTKLGVIVASASALLVAMVAPAQAVTTTAAATADAAASPQSVIVLMRDQHPDLKPKVQAQQRAAAVQGDQTPVVQDLKAHGATDLQQLDTVSAVAAKVKPAEIDRLRANPDVSAVVPDLTLYPKAAAPASTAKAKLDRTICPADPSKPLLEPEALDLTHTTAAQKLATGKGVKVAFVADGIDVDNPDFIRADGSHVISDYQDFSGDGVNDSSGGDESFGDASSIAAQGNRTYDLATELPLSGLPAGCTVKIKGFAPDADLVGIKIFGQNGASTSGVVRGIDYAVNHDKVDILSESFGSNPYPDPSTDPVTLADRAAIDAGVTVVASSGDSGVSGTMGSPATDPRIIAVGATTANRIQAQAYGYKDWTNDNITALSSGGPSLNGKLVDLVAPGYGGLADCTVDPRWDGCTSITEPFGGTSESAPFVAGSAALVIQAYKSAHHGASPTPDLVKRLLTGTATDLDVPADQQGAGLVDSDAAVKAALAIDAPSAQSTALVPAVGQVDLTGKGGTAPSTSITLTNTSSQPQKVTRTSRALGAQTFETDKTVGITAPADPANLPLLGGAAAAPFTFDVAAGTPLLDATMTWPGTADSGQLSMVLEDPQGRYVQQSYDYGFTDYQYINVHDPVAGKWTAKIVWSNGRGHLTEKPITPGSFRGNALVRFTGHSYASAGVTGTAAKTIPAGGSATFDLKVPLPAAAGDAPASIQFDSGSGQHLTVPVDRRTLIPTDAGKDNNFAVTVTGGVGRVVGEERGYYLDVPAGHRSLSIDLGTPDSATPLEFYLVSPDKQIISADVNATEKTWNTSSTRAGSKNANLTADRPMAGRWQLLAILTSQVSGKAFSEQVTGKLRFDQTTARGNNLPSGSKIKAGSTVTASVEVTNTGAAGQYFFLDPRLAGQTKYALTPYQGDSKLTLPVHTSGSTLPSFIVPPHTSRIDATATASLPVDIDLFFDKGNPEILAKAKHAAGNSVTATDRADQVAAGSWTTDVQQPGPTPNGAAAGTAAVSFSATGQQFDPWATSSTGDYWQRAVAGPAAKPLFVVPGVSSSINFSITPTAPVGTVVHGVVYVDTLNPLAGTGSELIGLPYSYTVS